MGAPPLPKFSPAQREHILTLLNDFTKYLTQYNPNVQNYHAGTTKWISTTSAAIMRHDLFELDNLSGRDPSEVEGDIRTFFRNWKNNTYKKSLPGTITITSMSAPSGGPCPSPTPTSSASPGLSVALNDVLRGLVIFESDLSAKELMFRENPGAYKTAYQAIKAELPPDTPTVVIAQKARKRAWDSANQEEWEQRKRSLELDTARNQVVWAPFLREAIQQNLDRGIVGSSAVGVMYAFRTESEGLQYGILYAGHNAATKTEIQHQPPSHEEILKLWREHADICVPHLKTPEVHQFKRDSQTNFPKLPELDLDVAVVGRVTGVLTHYLAAVWDHGYPADNAMPCLPWLRLALDPDAHYDTGVFEFPWTLGQPIPCKRSDILNLYEGLKQLQDVGTPFKFRSKEDILGRARAAATRLEADLEQGDEIVETPEGAPVRPVGGPDPAVEGVVDTPLVEEGVTGEFIAKPVTEAPALEVPVVAEPLQEEPATEEAVSEQPAVPKAKKVGLKRSLDESTNGQGSARRGSTRMRKAVEFGVTLVANGQRSPQGRKSSWFLSVEAENQAPTLSKRARRL